MANVVTRAAHSLSLAEKRILMAGIARLGGKNEMVKITAAEYAETYDVSLNTAYDQLKAAVENIFDRYLQFQVWEGKKKALNVSAGLMPTNTLIRKAMSVLGSGIRFSPTSSN